MQIQFEGKTVLVTGGAQGLGAAIAEAFVAAGANLIIWDISADALKATSARLVEISGRKVVTHIVDVSRADDVRAAVQRLDEVDVLVNNAGIQLKKSALDLTPEDWRRVLAVDLDSVLFCSQAVAPGMIKRRGGAIINISSCVVGFGIPIRVPYAVAKAGLVQLTRTLAVEWAEHHVRVNAVAPGYMLTEMVEQAFMDGYITRPDIEAKIAMRRLGQPYEIAAGVLFLASEHAGYVTGQTLTMDGGYSITK